MGSISSDLSLTKFYYYPWKIYILNISVEFGRASVLGIKLLSQSFRISNFLRDFKSGFSQRNRFVNGDCCGVPARWLRSDGDDVAMMMIIMMTTTMFLRTATIIIIHNLLMRLHSRQKRMDGLVDTFLCLHFSSFRYRIISRMSREKIPSWVFKQSSPVLFSRCES